jgi:hypothetical protein
MYEMTIAIEKIVPFLSEGSDLVIHVANVNGDEGTYTATVQASFNDGVSRSMLNAISPVAVAMDFNTMSESQQSMELKQPDVSPEIKPALPHVDNEYDEIRDKVGGDLGVPIQTLCGTSQSFPQTQITHTAQVSNNAPAPPQPLPQQQVAQQSIPQQQVPQQQVPQSQVQQPIPQQLAPAPAPAPAVPEDPRDAQLREMKAQFDTMQNMMMQMAQGVPPESIQQAPVKREIIPSIMTLDEFTTIVDSMGDIPEVDTSKRLSKQEAVELERYKLPKPAYVITNPDIGLLSVDDIGVTLRPNLACNLASIPMFKIKKSAQLQNALRNGMASFVDSEVARVMAEQADQEAGFDVGPGHLPAYIGPDGEGIERANQQDTDVTPNAGGGGGAIFDRTASNMGHGVQGASPPAMIVNDVSESDYDEQSSLISMTRDPSNAGPSFVSHEAPSPAMVASQQTAAVVAAQQERMAGTGSKTWKPATRLGE